MMTAWETAMVASEVCPKCLEVIASRSGRCKGCGADYSRDDAMIDTEWLAGLKPGDEVAYGDDQYGYVICTIDRITPKQLVIGKGHYLRSNGRRYGNAGTCAARIQPVTDTIRDNLKRN